jgi:transcription initiation factor TFIIIB Brf1 subunit/transcription initiation factor TFIIB
LAIAAAREFGVYPFDLMTEPNSPQLSISVPASTPRTLDSLIKETCQRIGISDECSDHADSLFSCFKSKDSLLDSNHDSVAAACIYLAEQATQAGLSCSIDTIATAFNCSAFDIIRLSTKLRSMLPNSPHETLIDVPVFYACVCDFGLSKVSCPC